MKMFDDNLFDDDPIADGELFDLVHRSLWVAGALVTSLVVVTVALPLTVAIKLYQRDLKAWQAMQAMQAK